MRSERVLWIHVDLEMLLAMDLATLSPQKGGHVRWRWCVTDLHCRASIVFAGKQEPSHIEAGSSMLQQVEDVLYGAVTAGVNVRTRHSAPASPLPRQHHHHYQYPEPPSPPAIVVQ